MDPRQLIGRTLSNIAQVAQQRFNPPAAPKLAQTAFNVASNPVGSALSFGINQVAQRIAPQAPRLPMPQAPQIGVAKGFNNVFLNNQPLRQTLNPMSFPKTFETFVKAPERNPLLKGIGEVVMSGGAQGGPMLANEATDLLKLAPTALNAAKAKLPAVGQGLMQPLQQANQLVGQAGKINLGAKVGLSPKRFADAMDQGHAKLVNALIGEFRGNTIRPDEYGKAEALVNGLADRYLGKVPKQMTVMKKLEALQQMATFDQTTANPGFKEMFNNEKGFIRLGPSPKPATIYHGTSTDAAATIESKGFDLKQSADGSVWFTDKKELIDQGQVTATGKGGVVQRLVDEKKLKLGGWDEADKYSTDELLNMGYDGLKLPDQGHTTYQIFNPEKLSKAPQPGLKAMFNNEKGFIRLGSAPKDMSSAPSSAKAPGSQSFPDSLAQLDKTPGLGTDDKNAFANWVNSRRAVDVEKALTQRSFQDLDNLGIQGFFDIQLGKKTNPRFNQVRAFLDKKYKQAELSGNKFNYLQDYLPQVWNNTTEEVAQVFGNRVSTRGGFALNRVISDYQAGIKAGLTPKFGKLSDLLADYEGRVNKVLADREFFGHLNKQKLILPSKEAPEGWVSLNPDKFPKLTGLEANDFYKAPPELAEMVNNYLYSPSDGNAMQRGLNHVANYVSKVKNIALSFGVPGTAINSHGINILARHTMFGQGGNMVTRFMKGANYLVNQYSSGKHVERILPDLPAAVKRGLTVSVEDRKSIIESESLRSMFGEAWSKTFETALFDKMIPALKFDSYQALVKDFAKTMPRVQAEREAAKMVNTIYGGINWEQVGRSRDLQNVLRSFILAPDWAETTLKLGGNFAKAMRSNGPVARKYQNMMAGFVTAYLAANVTNKLGSGKWMWENDPGHSFEIEIGYTPDGQKRYLRPFGTAADMVRLPLDVVTSLAKGDLTAPVRIVRNRLSIPAGVGVGLLTDTDYRGQPIGWRGKDKYGNELEPTDRVVGVGGELLSLAGLPNFVRQGLKTGSGQQGLEQGLTQGFELPVRYSGGAFSASQKQVEGIAKNQGIEGKELYDLNEKMRGQTKLSDNQYLHAQGSSLKDPNSNLDQILNVRAANKEIDTSDPRIAQSLRSAPAGSVGGSAVTNGSGSVFTLMDDNGKVRVVDLSQPIPSPKLTGQVEVDKILNSQYYSKLNARAKDIALLAASGQIDAIKAEAEIAGLKAKSSKGKKPKKLKFKKVTLKAPPKVKRTKIKLKQPKLVKFKSTKAKKASKTA